ncbi:MAG: hypothetical protein JST70_06520 [Bacteroidetes bacterium]|nr:hypothetical protein [Bacteroidota bacterium]
MPIKPKFLHATILLLLCSLTVHADPLNSDSFGDAIVLFLTLLFVDACSFLYFISLPFLSAGKINNWWTRFLSILILLSFVYFHFSIVQNHSSYNQPSLTAFYSNNFKKVSKFTTLILFAWLGFIISTWRLIREFLRLVKEE